MAGETTTVTETIETDEVERQEELTDAIIETGEEWQQQFSAAVLAMREVVGEIRASNTENATLREQVSQLLSVNRDLTNQVAEQSARQAAEATRQMEAMERLTLLVTPRNQTHHSDDSRTESQENTPLVVDLPAAIEPEAIPEAANPPRPKRRAI